MNKYLILTLLLTNALFSYSQNVTECDSSYIYKHFLFYHLETNTYDDIDEPFLEEYWFTEKENAKKYFFKAAFLKSIPIGQRVIMVSYLDKEKKLEAHQWMYGNMETKKDTVNYFRILNTGYGIPYSDLKIPEEKVKLYCEKCNYK
jgi:hypothetical protein